MSNSIDSNVAARARGLELIKEGLGILDESVCPYTTEGVLLPMLRVWLESFKVEFERSLVEETEVIES